MMSIDLGPVTSRILGSIGNVGGAEPPFKGPISNENGPGSKVCKYYRQDIRLVDAEAQTGAEWSPIQSHVNIDVIHITMT